MHNRFTSRKALPLLLLFAMLIVSVAVILPMVVSADAAEIQDFSYQTLTDLNVKTSENTALRFVFTIGDLDSYDEVGVIVSKSVATPTYDAANCFTYKTTTVYSKITVDGTPEPAPDGRWWVAVQLTGIPHSYFDGSLYLRAFAKKTNQDLVYSEPAALTVCSAGGHVHTTYPSSGTATLDRPGTVVGHCNGCNLDVTEYNARAVVSPSVEYFKNSKSSIAKFDRYVLVKDLLSEGKTFSPSSENNNEGRDFYFQIDFLYNDSISNCADDVIKFCFYNDTTGANKGKNCSFFLLITKDNSTDTENIDCGFEGGFDWSGEGCQSDPSNEGPAGGYRKGFANYPNLSASSGSKDYGWHRIGVRIHQEADTEANPVTYSGYAYLYIDGVQRWKVKLNTDSLAAANLLLFTYDKGQGKYVENSDTVYFDFWSDNVDTSSNPVYMVFANPVFKAVKPSDFATGVAPVANPVAREYTIPSWPNSGYTYPAKTVSAKVFFDNTVIHTSGAADSDFIAEGMKSLSEIRGSDHFYKDSSNNNAGRNLYFEYSILWSNSLLNWKQNWQKGNGEIKVASMQQNLGASRANHKEFYLLYIRDNGVDGLVSSTDCPYAGHFDYSIYASADPKQNCAEDLTSENIYFRGNRVGRYGAGWTVGKDGRNASPYISDAENDSMNGWHHIGVLIHQEATSPGGTTVNYSGWSELFIDGVKVWQVNTDMGTLKSQNLLLFTADAKGGTITKYTDAPNNVYLGYRFDKFEGPDATAYAIIKDANWSIVPVTFDPSTVVEPVAVPISATYTLPNGSEVPAGVYFRLK